MKGFSSERNRFAVSFQWWQNIALLTKDFTPKPSKL